MLKGIDGGKWSGGRGGATGAGQQRAQGAGATAIDSTRDRDMIIRGSTIEENELKVCSWTEDCV
jgi:hypothetical protein